MNEVMLREELSKPSNILLLISRDEIVKRGDTMTCGYCERRGAKNPDGTHVGGYGSHYTCTGRGTAIYELLCEAVGQKS